MPSSMIIVVLLILGYSDARSQQVLRLQGVDTGPVSSAQKQVLHALSTQQLLAQLTADSSDAHLKEGYSIHFDEAVAEELVSRRPIHELLVGLHASTDPTHRQQDWIAKILSRVRSPETDSAVHILATTDTSYSAFLAVMYFADSGEPWALGILNANFWRYHLFSFERQNAILVFCRFRYGPAAGNLAQSLRSLNVTTVAEAEEALRAIFPEVRTTFSTIGESRRFWTSYVERHRPTGLRAKKGSSSRCAPP